MSTERGERVLVKRASWRDLRAACLEVTGGARVLVVEDRDDVALVLKKALVRAGHSVDVAGTLREARAMVGPWKVGVFDYRLPDGTTTLLAQGMAREGKVSHVVSFSGTPRDEAPIGDHVLDKATAEVADVVALVTRLAAL